jgi:nitroreductase
MTSMHTTALTAAHHARAGMDVLAEAAIGALRAPSILNTQPWRWRFGRDSIELWADRGRQLPGLDPDGRLLMLSCGTALDHAVAILHAAQYSVNVERLPIGQRPDLVARIRCGAQRPAESVDSARYGAIYARRTDRRPFTDVRPPDEDLDALRAAAERHNAHLHVLSPAGVLTLAAVADRAGRIERADEILSSDLVDWTNRPGTAGDGISARTVASPGRRTVVPRDFGLDAPARPVTAGAEDRGTVYAVLFTDADDPVDWVRAGEALSDVWLTLTSRGLAASPISEVVELPAARQQLRELLGSVGYPAIAMRIGVPARAASPPPSPRREVTDVIGLQGSVDRS